MEGRGTGASAFDECFALHSLAVAKAVRLALRHGRVEPVLLARLYSDYNPVSDPALFVERALGMFPRLCCGLATAYVQQQLGEGTIVRGAYGNEGHTYLVARGSVVDVTADQFGGPEVYVGPIVSPWRCTRPVGRVVSDEPL